MMAGRVGGRMLVGAVFATALVLGGGIDGALHGGAGATPSALHDPDMGAGNGANASADTSLAFAESFPRHSVPPTAFARGIRQAQGVHILQSAPWQELGPVGPDNANFPNPKTNAATAISGRLTAIAVDPSSCSGDVCNTLYIGAAGGGVWKSTDAGQTWTPLLDDQPVLSIGAIVLDPQNPNIVYAGTGDATHGHATHGGIGILQSTDGGQTWTVLGQSVFQNRAITSIIIDPRTAGTSNATLYASTTASGSGGSATISSETASNPNLPPRGIYKSTDGGQTWALSNSINNRSSPVESLALDPSNPDMLYAGFDGMGVFRSGDAGQSWQEMDSGLPSANVVYVKVAVSSSDDQVVYAAFYISGDHEDDIKLFRSTDGAQSWTAISAPNSCANQCYSNMILTVDPGNANTLYVGGTANYGYLFGEKAQCATFSPLPAACNATLMKSSDAGQTWADVAENGTNGPLHPDAHAILVDPANPNVVYFGCDGGLFHSADGGQTWNDLNHGLGTTQINSVAVDHSGNVFAGLQDNGSFAYTAADHSWLHVASGDGGVAGADPTSNTISYNTRYGASLYRDELVNGKHHNIDIAPFSSDYDTQHRGNFYEPYALAPSHPKDLFFGTYRVWRSKLAGGIDGNHDGVAYDSKKDKTDWVPISFDLSCDHVPSDPSTTCDSDSNSGDGIAAVAVSQSNPNIVVAAASDGYIWLTTNALAKVHTTATCDPRRHRDGNPDCNFVKGVTWTRIDNGLPGRYPTAVRFDPRNDNTIYVTFSGFDENTSDTPGHVFVSTNRGQSWTGLTGGDASHRLPDLPFSDIVINPTNGHLYASADYGVYVSADNGQTWNRFDGGLPAVPVFQMTFYGPSNTLIVGTYGRGVWQTSAP